MEEQNNDPVPAPTPATPPAIKRKTLSITIRDKPILYAAYMSFLKQGGLFIPTRKYFAMGEEIMLMITLLDEEKKYSVKCKVVWLTPANSQGNKAGGIGIEFSEDREGDSLRKRIEDLLGSLLLSTDATHTM